MSLSEQILDALAARPGAPSERAALLKWSSACDPVDPPGISRFLFALFRARADLQQTFLGIYLDPDARLRYLLWAHYFAGHETGAPSELIPPLPAGVTSLTPAPVVDPSPRQRGVGVLGYLRAIHGLGAAARRLVRILDSIGEPLRLYPYDHTIAPLLLDGMERDSRLGVARSHDDVEFPDVLVAVLGPHELSLVPVILGGSALAGVKRIGLLFWETDVLPPELADGFTDLCEVWVTSEYTAAAVRPILPKSTGLHIIPLGASVLGTYVDPAVRAEARRGWSERLGVLPTTIVAGQVFDYSSGVERKNPSALVHAWCLAFPQADPIRRTLVFKTIGSGAHPELASEFRVRVSSLARSDVCFVDDALPPEQHAAFMERLDLVASLHRAEGYGLVLLEAMYRGIPVIASAYSGNLAFMNEANSWLVPCGPTVLQADEGPYPAGSAWGEPDVAAAAAALLDVTLGLSGQDPLRAKQVADRVSAARMTAQPLVDGSAAATAVQERLAVVRATQPG